MSGNCLLDISGMNQQPGKLEEQLRGAMRLRQMSLRTEEVYVGWYRRYVKWAGLRHPATMGAREIEAFLTELAMEGRVVATTQNQAMNALIFLYREVLKQEVFDFREFDKNMEAAAGFQNLISVRIDNPLQIRLGFSIKVKININGS